MEVPSFFGNIKHSIHSFYTNHRSIVLLLVVGILVHFAASIFLYSKFGNQVLFFENEDAHSYVDLAQSISEGKGFVREGEVSAYRTPLYPLFLSVLFILKLPFIGSVLLLQNFLASFAGVMLYTIGKKIFSHRAGLIAFFLYTFEPYLLLTSNVATTETFFVFLLICGTYFFIRFFETEKLRYLAAVGGVCGLLTLTRPVAFYLPFVVAFVFFISIGILKKQWKKLMRVFIILFGVYVLVLSPWLIRQYIHYQTFHITNIDAFMLYARVAPIVEMKRTGTDYQTAAKLVMKRLEERPGYTYDAVINRFDFYMYMKDETKRMVTEDPAPVIRFYAVSSIPALFGTGYEYILENVFDLPRSSSRLSYTEVLLTRGISGIYEIFTHLDIFQIILLISIGLWTVIYLSIMILLSRRSTWQQYGIYVLFLFVSACYFTFFTLGPASQVRYRIPSFPFFFLLFAFAIDRMLSHKSKAL